MDRRRVVILCDEQWPAVPGVCCWRHTVHLAFEAADAAVSTVTSVGPDHYADLPNADLVIAETAATVETAAANGVPCRRIYLLALPPEPEPPGSQSSYADQLRRLAPLVGGFITDSELAREAVEQALTHQRPRVEVFPPFALDRNCPDCLPGGDDTDLADEPALLNRWHGLAEQILANGLEHVPDSFAAARLLGPMGQRVSGSPWVPGNLAGWRPGASGDCSSAGPPSEPTPASAGASPGPEMWSAKAQQSAARRILARSAPAVGRPARPPRPVLLAGFNLKFAGELAQRLDDRPDLDLVVDEWETESQPTEATPKLLDQTESVFAEWVRPSTVWLAEHKRPDQFLAVRLHRYELESPHPRRLNLDRVDAVVYIAPLFGRRIRDELGWPVEKLVYIPNMVDLDWFDRPKLPDARFGLGVVGIESMRKRFDLALDLLAEVRRVDPRFTMFVRSVLPWDNPSFWRHQTEREHALWCRERIRRDPLLRGGVVFEPPGRDMARWYRQVGQILSTSDNEGSHMAPAEGMASGAVPVIRPWPGAAEIYGDEWIWAGIEDAAAAVLDSADPATWAERSERARAEISRTHNPDAATAAWSDLLHGDVPAARAHFAEYSPL